MLPYNLFSLKVIRNYRNRNGFIYITPFSPISYCVSSYVVSFINLCKNMDFLLRLYSITNFLFIGLINFMLTNFL